MVNKWFINSNISIKKSFSIQILAHPDVHADASTHSVFFDFLGVVLVHYTETLGIILNLVVVALSLFGSYRKMRNAHELGMNR